MSTALPAIESVISSIVLALPCLGSRTTVPYVGSPGLNFNGQVTLWKPPIRPRLPSFSIMLLGAMAMANLLLRKATGSFVLRR